MDPVVPPPEAERIEELVFECLEAMEAEGSAALERACTSHPALATVLRQRIHALQSTGLIRQRDGDEPFPERLGEFRLLRRLGGGGMGVVYLAVQESLGREVALKLIRPEHLYFDGSRKRFQREVEACARLTHPSIVPVYVVGEAQGIPYFAMERIEGASLAEVLAQLAGRDPAELSGADLARALAEAMGRPAPEAPPAPLFEGSWINAVARVAMQVADALAHAHGRGIVHRDIKPSNVMLTPAGRVLLLDFGLAQSEGALRLTRSGSALGSLLYMPPEIVKGSVKDTSALSDIYSLGVTLYELLTLHPPYQAEDAEATRRRILAGAPRSPRALNRSVPWDVETVCVTAMALEPDRRYASVEALGRDLRNVLELKPIEARRPGLMLRIRRAAQRNPTGALSLLLLFVLVIVVPSAFALHQRAAREDAERRGYVGNVAAAANSLRLLDVVEARRMLRNCSEHLRNWEWHRLWRRAHRGTAWTAHGGAIENLALSPDQKRLVTAGCDGTFAVWEASTRALQHRISWPTGEMVLDAAWSPDGALIAAIAVDGTVRQWETAGLTPRETFPARLPLRERVADVTPRVVGETLATLYAVAFSPDGRWIAAGGFGNELRIMDRSDPEADPLRVPHPGQLRRLLWLHDSSRVVTAGVDGRVRFVDASRGVIQGRVLDAHPGGVLALALSRDGTWLATGGADRMVRIWQVPPTAAPRLLTGHTEPVTALAFDSTGERLASCGLDGTARLWDVDTGDLRATWCAGVELKCVGFAPGDREVLASGKDGQVHVFACHDVDELAQVRMENGWTFCAEPSKDGTRLYLAGMVPAVLVFDAQTGERLPDLIECGADLWHLARSPDGTRLAVALTRGLKVPGELLLVDIAAGEVVRRWRSQDGDGTRRVVFAPDGRTLAFGGAGGPVTLAAVDRDEVLRRLEGHTAEVMALRFSPDGRWLASASNDRDVRLWSMGDGSCRLLRGHSACVNCVEFTPDGTRLVSGSLDKTIRVWDVASGACVAVLEGHREAVRALTFTADGSRLISGSFGGVLLVWDFHAQATLAVLSGHKAGINWFTWSPDQSRLYSLSLQGELRVW